MKINTYSQALEYIYSFIPPKSQLFPGSFGVEKTQYFLSLLDNPQDKLKIVHIAGTSGKGSTSAFMSTALMSQGFKVGLQMSPHVFDIRERFQINNQLLPQDTVVKYLNELIPTIEKVEESTFGKPSYFELLVVLSFYIFWKEKVDYAVVETGLGGLYDATNTIHREDKCVIITRIGHDHIHVLGKTLDKIAFQKAGIIHEKNNVITVKQDYHAQKVFDTVCKERGADLSVIKHFDNYWNERIKENKVEFNFSFEQKKLKKIQINSSAMYQVENCSLALAMLVYISKRDNFTLNETQLRNSFFQTSIPGRMQQILINGKTLIVDGAHNPQKMKAFTSSLSAFSHVKYSFLIAFKKDKDYRAILKYITPLADKIIITTFFSDKHDLLQFSQDPQKIAANLEEMHFSNYEIIEKSEDAFHKLVDLPSPLVITGSFYLIGELSPLLNNLS